MLNETKFWEEMRRRLEDLSRSLDDSALFIAGTTGSPTFATGAASVPPSLTIADVERAVADIDPDGRRLQEGRLLAECSTLTKEEVETVIRFAESIKRFRIPPGGIMERHK